MDANSTLAQTLVNKLTPEAAAMLLVMDRALREVNTGANEYPPLEPAEDWAKEKEQAGIALREALEEQERLSALLANTEAKLKEAEKGWRVPNENQLLRLVQPLPQAIPGTEAWKVGETLLVALGAGSCTDPVAQPEDKMAQEQDPTYWARHQVPAVQCIEKGANPLNCLYFLIPLRCVEAVYE